MLRLRLTTVLLLAGLAACQDAAAPDAAPVDLAIDRALPDLVRPDLAPPDLPRPDAALPCPKYAQPVKTGTVTLNVLDEASGIAVSRTNSGVIWAHNDSGDVARIYAVSTKGKTLGLYTLTGAAAYDWEDMATGPGPTKGATYLYLGDIGDNARVRTSVQVYRVEEPTVKSDQAEVTAALSGVVKLDLKYPDGAHNAETLLVDPNSGDLYIVVKDLMTGVSPVYRSAAPHDEKGTRTLTKITTLSLGKGNLTEAKMTATTAGDISASGGLVLIKTYLDVFLWRWPPGVALGKVLDGKPCALPIASEPQGEAIAFDAKTDGYYTLSEHAKQPLHFFAAPK